MTFYYSDFPEVKFDYIKYNSNYEIDRQLFYDSIEEAKKDANRIYNLLVYKIKNGNKKDICGQICGQNPRKGKGI